MSARSRWASLAVLLVVAAVAGVAAWTRVLAAPTRDHDVATGRALYTQYCASCHGPSGRGDGPSAGGLATKPADLTDGRVMNPLPDEFLASVIERGGPAEGLAPTMPGFGAYLGDPQIRSVIVFLRTLAQPAFDPGKVKPVVSVPGAPRQPIFFSHLIHAESFQISCQYCHADARRSEYAGLPSVDRCMGCHKIIGATDNPEIQKIHDYFRRGAPIPWVRVFKVPEFTYFPHKAHVRAAVECQTCHGPIERMRVVGAETGPSIAHDLMFVIGLRPPPRALTMGWCLDCHREQNRTRNMKAPMDCVACHH
ncbi:MAG: c-type cytochrome [Candidatus Rokubacteria bacterium]|nr:c-type cytochrome [Candidatus Rokubacteria bacterium]